MAEEMNFRHWQERLRTYAKDRAWEQFHTPKNLAMALSVEASELVEIFQWMTGKSLNPSWLRERLSTSDRRWQTC